MEYFKDFLESQGQSLALTVLFVPSSFESGPFSAGSRVKSLEFGVEGSNMGLRVHGRDVQDDAVCVCEVTVLIPAHKPVFLIPASRIISRNL